MPTRALPLNSEETTPRRAKFATKTLSRVSEIVIRKTSEKQFPPYIDNLGVIIPDFTCITNKKKYLKKFNTQMLM